MRELVVPDISWPLSLEPQQLSLDLVEITIRGIRVEGEAAKCWRVLQSLPKLRVPVSGGGTTPLFYRPHRRDPFSPLEAKVRRSTRRVNGLLVAPVFKGRLVARRERLPTHSYAGSQECVNISLELKLNVPRFLSKQSYRRTICRGTGPVRDCMRTRMKRPVALAGPRSVVVHADEAEFGRDGNVLMGEAPVYQYAASKCFSLHCFDLINAIVEAISSWLRDRLNRRHNQLICSPSFSLAQVEWHAEFWTFSPRRQVNLFTPALLRQGKTCNIFRRRLTGQVRQYGPHSHAIQIALAKGISQTTYSKTSRRVRVEMKYKRACFRRLIGRRIALREEDLGRALETLRHHASRELQNVFDELLASVAPASDGPSRDDLVGIIAHFSQGMAFFEEIVRSLRDTGRVVVENGSSLRPTVDILRHVRVLSFVRHSVYTVTVEFEAALRELMSQPGAAMETQMRAISATGGSQSEAT